MIKDTGERREFDSGAVRDISEGKGRCDLMPLEVVSRCFLEYDGVLPYLARFRELGGSTSPLMDALGVFASEFYGDMYTMLLDVSIQFEEGCAKYGDDNWRKGIPTHSYLDSAVRHYLKFRRGDTDENHKRAFVWNVMCCIWTCNHMPHLNDYADWMGTDDVL